MCIAAGLSLLAWQTARSDITPASQPATQAAIADTQPTPAVVSLVAKLSDDSFKVRENAQSELIRLAEEAEPSLKALLKTDLSPEAKARVEASLRKIEENRLVGPSIITMHYTDAPMEAVLEDFSKQAGADMGIHRKEIADFIQGKKATVDLDHVSFWTALRAISQSSGLSVPPNVNYGNVTSKMTLEIANRSGPAMDLSVKSMTTAGPFVVIPQQCAMTRVINYGHGMGMGMGVPMNGGSPFSLTMMYACEPKLHIVGGIGNDCIRSVVDDKGHDLSAGRANMFFGMGVQGWCWSIPTQLHEAPDMGKKIATVKGVIKASVMTQSIALVVDDVYKSGAVTKRAGNMAITFTGAKTENNQNTLDFSITAAADNPFVFQQIQMLINQMEVTDANGQRIQVGLRMMNNNNSHMEMSVGAFGPANQKPKKLVWEIPSETRAVEFPFEIHDLALP